MSEKYFQISVCIFSRNPRQEEFIKVANALENQTLDKILWELVIIDNKSDIPLRQQFRDLFLWHPYVRFVLEPNYGFPYCHKRVFIESKAELILIIADDNILHANYLSNAVSIMKAQPSIGVLTGLVNFHSPAGISKFSKKLHDHIYNDGGFTGFIKSKEMKKYTPALRGSAGMILRKAVGLKYLEVFPIYELLMMKLKENGINNLRGTDLDIPMLAMKHGYFVARSSEIIMEHHASKEEIEVVKILKSYYLMCFSEQLFKFRWGWTERPIVYLFFAKNFFKAIFNIYQILNPLWVFGLCKNIAITRSNHFLKTNKIVAEKIKII